MRHLLVPLLGGLALLAGCQTAATVTGADVALKAADSAVFLNDLSTQETVTEAQALHGLLLALGEEADTTFAGAVESLRQRRIVGASWDFRADRPVTKGRVAYMFYQACRLEGGLTLFLTGPSQRYCLKELQYRGFMGPGLFYNDVTGMEYVSILSRIDEITTTGRVSDVMIREDAQ